MSTKKRLVREAFRLSVFERDRHCCRCCGAKGKDRQGGEHWKEHHKNVNEAILVDLDAHHISSRDIMPNGGYVLQNGISVCNDCHLKAEEYWSTGCSEPGFSPEELYELIGSSYELAFAASERFGEDGAWAAEQDHSRDP